MQTLIKYKNYDVFFFSKVFGIPVFLLGLLVFIKFPEITTFGIFFAVLGLLLIGFSIEYVFHEKEFIQSKKMYFLKITQQCSPYNIFENINVDVVSTIGGRGMLDRSIKHYEVELLYKDKAGLYSGVNLTGCIKARNRTNTSDNSRILKNKLMEMSKVSGLFINYTERYKAETTI